MENEHFDQIARSLAAAPSRRGAVRLLAGTAIAMGSGLLSRVPRAAGAQVTPADAQCEAGPVISNNRCRANQCRGRLDCFCARTTGGERKCVELLFEKGLCNRNQCRRDRDCPQGELCVEIGGCCEVDQRVNVCVSPCG